MKLTIEIDCDNDAFTDDTGEVTRYFAWNECRRIIDDLGDGGREDRRLRDTNGNRVGTLTWSGE